MGSSVPKDRPQLPALDVRKLAEHMGITVRDPKHPAVFAIRGYYRDSMGRKGQNDRGIYDDAAWIILHDRCVPFNFNTDPSAHKFGRAVLEPGLWLFIPGKHKIGEAPPRGRPGYRQFGLFDIRRDGNPDVIRGYFGINLHDGGDEHTSSEGCQTVPKAQWAEFKKVLNGALGVTEEQMMADPNGVDGKMFPYGLMTREQAEKVLGREL